MVHPYNNVLAIGSSGLGVIDQNLVVPRWQKSCIHEVALVLYVLVKVWRVHCVNVSQLVVVAFVI